MQAVIMQCRPRTRFHFGKVAPDNNTSLNDTTDYLPSDTLFSAIINTLALTNDKAAVDRIIGHFISDKIRISSGFYVIQIDDRFIYMLPKPAHIAYEVTSQFKDFNKIRFISRTVWEEGWHYDTWQENCFFLQKGAVVVAKSDLPELATALNNLPSKKMKDDACAQIRLFSIDDYPRVKVHAQSRQDAFFYLATICIADTPDLSNALTNAKVHLYFLLETNEHFDQHEDYKCILTAINMLPDQGVGGERSTGCGMFEGIDFKPFAAFSAKSQGQFCSVSLTLPNDEKEFSEIVAYGIQTRGGRDHNGGKLKFVRMMNEGAVANSVITGRIAEIGDGQTSADFLRYGKSFCLPIRTIQ